MAKNKLLYGMLLAMSLSLTACGNSSTVTGNGVAAQSQGTENDGQTEEEITTFGRVTAVDDQTITIMAMGFGNRERGEKPEGTMSPEEFKEGEKPEGTMPPDMEEKFQKGEKPEGTMPPDMEEKFQKGEKPEGTMPSDLPEGSKRQGEEKTVTILESTSIVKQNEDGTTETVDISQITEGTMIEITGTESGGSITATKIMINTNMKQGGMGRNSNSEGSQEQNGQSA